MKERDVPLFDSLGDNDRTTQSQRYRYALLPLYCTLLLSSLNLGISVVQEVYNEELASAVYFNCNA